MSLNEKLFDTIITILYKLGKKKLYTLEGEKIFVKELFKDLKNTDITEKRNKLIKNLDKKDVELIDNIITRVQMLLNSKEGEKLDLYTTEEKIRLKKIKHFFGHKIKDNKDGTFTYKNYRLPENHFEEKVFYYDCLIDSFDDISDLKDRSIIDVGGYIGDSALILSKFTQAPIYVFEPVETIYNMMQKTLEMNKALWGGGRNNNREVCAG